MNPPQGALLVGSVNLPDAESTFRAAAKALTGRLKRIPDGEVGDRVYWMVHQADYIARTPGIERVGDTPVLFNGCDLRPVRVADGVDPGNLVLSSLGYARDALNSWTVFERLQQAGVINPATKFQVSLPTPLAVVAAFATEDQRGLLEPIYERALFAELDAIQDTIPRGSLAIQWDTSVEFGLIEKTGYPGFLSVPQPWFGDVWQGIIERAGRQACRVREEVELGFHLCYGDAGEQHFIEPVDTTNLARFAGELFAASPRQVNWVHLPVPIGRHDDAYFVPLRDLPLPEHTELYLGLVHREDGIQGARRRIKAASRHVPRFGVATECGAGRAPTEAIETLLETHREVCEPW
ncbi:hypothetical protein GA0061083_0054 [Pseudarthrobacter enclensis]|uniref:hypothetical protein n=1 Tax=Pseudarthrobacter enclensis TaxID=993070 RepID=UPI0008160377|nr:hypothetical protein [Pseudarthrobacter enclensis]SCC30201.1 hypothetical protein GA0061083_0054 [Pseudarthrobacter enclensis]